MSSFVLVGILFCLPFSISSLVFGGAKCEGTAADMVGAGLVVDTRALLLSVVVVGGAFEDSYCWFAASMSMSSSFSECS